MTKPKYNKDDIVLAIFTDNEIYPCRVIKPLKSKKTKKFAGYKVTDNNDTWNVKLSDIEDFDLSLLKGSSKMYSKRETSMCLPKQNKQYLYLGLVHIFGTWSNKRKPNIMYYKDFEPLFCNASYAQLVMMRGVEL